MIRPTNHRSRSSGRRGASSRRPVALVLVVVVGMVLSACVQVISPEPQVIDWGTTYERQADGSFEFTVKFNGRIDASSIQPGVNVFFDFPNGPSSPITVSASAGPNNTEFLIVLDSIDGLCLPTPSCIWTLTLVGSGNNPLLDVGGDPLDGDRNGRPGGDTVLRYGLLDPSVTPVGTDACPLGPGTGAAVGLGVPRPSDRLPSTGPVDVAVLFVDYEDVSADRSPEEAFDLIAPEAVEFFDAMSYGRFEVRLHPHFEWLTLGPVADYVPALSSFTLHRDFLQEAIDAADVDVDFAGMEHVTLIGAPNASALSFGPAWVGFDGPGGQLMADGARITNGITSGADLTVWGWKWFPHELGHSLGLPDLYRGRGTDGFTRPFSMMDLVSSAAPEYLAYERWYLGWLDDAQVRCLPIGSNAGELEAGVEVNLSPIEVPGRTKAIMVPLGPERAVVVESRRAVGYDAALAEEGALVYVVDVSIPTLQGPIRVVNNRRLLQPGQTVTVEGITVSVLAANQNGDRVALSG